MRFLRAFPILVASAALGLVILWTVGPHAEPGTSAHGTQVLVFLGVVGLSVAATRRVWSRRVSH